MTDDFETAPVPIERDRWGRPKIRQADGSLKGYTRCTTYIDVLEDRSALETWKVRTTILGVMEDPTIVNVARVRTGEYKAGRMDERAWKQRLNALGEEALNVGGANARSSAGTDLHSLTEIIDAGKPLPDGLLDSDFLDMEAYRGAKARVGLIPVATEQFVVHDGINVAGTLDRIYLLSGEFTHPRTGLPIVLHNALVVGDVKTGAVHPGKVAMQVYIYATSEAYDNRTGRRSPLGVDLGGGMVMPVRTDLGLLVHLPQGEATCDVYLIDLETGSEGVSLAGKVRSWRNTGKRAINMKAAL